MSPRLRDARPLDELTVAPELLREDVAQSFGDSHDRPWATDADVLDAMVEAGWVTDDPARTLDRAEVERAVDNACRAVLGREVDWTWRTTVREILREHPERYEDWCARVGGEPRRVEPPWWSAFAAWTTGVVTTVLAVLQIVRAVHFRPLFSPAWFGVPAVLAVGLHALGRSALARTAVPDTKLDAVVDEVFARRLRVEGKAMDRSTAREWVHRLAMDVNRGSVRR